MILGVGLDLVEVRRMERSLNSPWGERLKARVFSAEEIENCEATPFPAQGYAARFAAKEAFAKALGTGFSRGVTPSAIRVRGRERERPAIALQGKTLELARSLHVKEIHLSLTHTFETACAFVVVEK